MAKPKIHLHRDYHNTWCKRDISHLPATFEPADATCGPCKKAFVADAEKSAREAAAEAERRIAEAREHADAAAAAIKDETDRRIEAANAHAAEAKDELERRKKAAGA